MRQTFSPTPELSISLGLSISSGLSIFPELSTSPGQYIFPEMSISPEQSVNSELSFSTLEMKLLAAGKQDLKHDNVALTTRTCA